MKEEEEEATDILLDPVIQSSKGLADQGYSSILVRSNFWFRMMLIGTVILLES
jgi:hypothetical protein